jgi:hypothetical protein
MLSRQAQKYDLFGKGLAKLTRAGASVDAARQTLATFGEVNNALKEVLR